MASQRWYRKLKFCVDSLKTTHTRTRRDFSFWWNINCISELIPVCSKEVDWVGCGYGRIYSFIKVCKLNTMSLSIGTLCRSAAQFIERPGSRLYWKAISRGKPHGVARTLAQRLEELNATDTSLHYKVNIGFSQSPQSRRDVLSHRLEHRRKIKSDLDIQKAAKTKSLLVDLDDVHAEWESTSGPRHTKEAAEYYGIFKDLYDHGYFLPIKPLRVSYKYMLNEEFVSPVFRGNILKSYEAASVPEVTYEAKDDELYTLVLTTPDCHLTDPGREYLHWFVGNIPGNKISKGQELCDYMQPFPLRGIGFCRYILVLYKQEKSIDFAKYARKAPCNNLTARTFSTLEFYQELQDDITPIGLSFFQSDWDPTLTNFFHDKLEMKEPSFEYDFPPFVPKPQPWFPHSKPFNIWMDKHKHPKQLQKELLLEKLKERHPFKEPPKSDKYPLAYKIDPLLPSWLKDDIRLRRMGEGKWKFM